MFEVMLLVEKYQVVKLWTLFCNSVEALMSIMQTQAQSYNLWPAKNLLEQLSCTILMVLSMLGNNNKIHLPSSLSSNQGDRPNQSLASCRSGVLQTIMQISRWI